MEPENRTPLVTGAGAIGKSGLATAPARAYRTKPPLMTNTQPLFQPLTIGDLTLPNRVVMAPMTRARATNSDLAPTELHAAYYAQRASAGLIVTEGTWVSRQAVGYLNVPGIYTDVQIAAWKQVTDAVHSAGGRIFVQLGHTGAKSHPNNRNGELPAGPSAVNPQEMVPTAAGPAQTLTPRAMTLSEIQQTIADYHTAADNALRAGFDGVEIHAQGPQLIGQFLSSRLNRRTDAYGGNVENRARFLLDVVDAVNAVWDTPRVSVKISPYWSNGTTFQTTDEILAGFDHTIGQLSRAGLALLHLMGANSEPGTTPTEDALLAPFVRYRPLFNGVLVANVGFTQTSANRTIERGLADAIAFGSSYLANPDLVERFVNGYPLARPDPATIFGEGAHGYIDYPTATAAAATATATK